MLGEHGFTFTIANFWCDNEPGRMTMLSTDEILYGYWGDKRRTILQIPALASPQEYEGQDVLRIACFRPEMTSARRKKQLAEWCEALPRMPVRILEIHPGVQELFEASLRITGLEALDIGYGPLKTLAPLPGCPSLKALRVESCPRLTGLEALAELPALEVLDLTNIRLAQNLDFVRQLQGLEELHVCGSLWTLQKLEDLWPVAELRRLRSLWFLSTRVLRDGLQPLHRLQTLENLMCDFAFRRSEFEALKAAVPALKYGTIFDNRINDYPRLAKG